MGRRHDDVKAKDVQVRQSHVQLDQVRSHILIEADKDFRKLNESRSLLDVAQSSRDAAKRTFPTVGSLASRCLEAGTRSRQYRSRRSSWNSSQSSYSDCTGDLEIMAFATLLVFSESVS
jgi:hypothetical protein